MPEIKSKKIGVLKNMAGDQSDFSLYKSSEIYSYILEHLKEIWKPVDIFIDKDYSWYFNGVPVVPSELLEKVDLVWNTSYPSIANILESLEMPTISMTGFSYFLDQDREALRKHAKSVGVNMPRRLVIPVYREDIDGERSKFVVKKAKEVFEKFGSPWIVKSFSHDSSLGIHLAKNFSKLVVAIDEISGKGQSVAVEEFISDKKFTVHSVRGFRASSDHHREKDQQIYSFLNNASSEEERLKMMNIAEMLCDHLDARHYLGSDFVFHPRRGIFLSDVRFFPELCKGSDFEKACEKSGLKGSHLIEHIFERALKRILR